MKDYLKEDLSDAERSEIKGIVWMVVRKHKFNQNKKQILETSFNDDLNLYHNDSYSLENFIFKDYRDFSRPLTETEKTEIVNDLNKAMDEVALFELKRTMTFNEKLVFFFLFVEKYKAKKVMFLLDVDRKTVYNRKESIKNKIEIMKGENNGR